MTCISSPTRYMMISFIHVYIYSLFTLFWVWVCLSFLSFHRTHLMLEPKEVVRLCSRQHPRAEWNFYWAHWKKNGQLAHGAMVLSWLMLSMPGLGDVILWYIYISTNKCRLDRFMSFESMFSQMSVIATLLVLWFNFVFFQSSSEHK